jgi:cob(I)alamin adenosyltransferase
MRITKVYTRGGDKGKTSLVGGRRVAKNDLRIEAYGTLDELNAIVGLTRTFNEQSDADPAAVQRLGAMLRQVQNDLFDLGSDLATPAESRWEGMYRIGDADIQRLETWIDDLNDDLGPLVEFILPGGGPVGAFMHQARTVCRRAERRIMDLQDRGDDLGDGPLRYVNRLSDFFFVAGRWGSKALGEPEYLWERRSRKP